MKYLINIILITLIYYLINNYLFENFQNYINPFYKNKSYCSYNKDKNICSCTFQKDNLGIGFKAPEDACNNTCLNKTQEKCNKNELIYYCKEGNKCIKYKGTNQNKYISMNSCGIDRLTNLIKTPYIDRKSCEKNISTCDKYNKDKLSSSEMKEKCLKDTKCGYCTNQYGEGKCIEGTAEGPLDLNSNCSPNNYKNNNNKYEYGNFNTTFI